jgi:hypothetical protein
MSEEEKQRVAHEALAKISENGEFMGSEQVKSETVRKNEV